MNQSESVKRLRRAHWRSLERLLKKAYQDGLQEGLARAHGQRRRGRTIRADATVEGLVRLIGKHFSLDRYGFDVRVVHAKSGRRVSSADLLRKYLVEE